MPNYAPVVETDIASGATGTPENASTLNAFIVSGTALLNGTTPSVPGSGLVLTYGQQQFVVQTNTAGVDTGVGVAFYTLPAGTLTVPNNATTYIDVSSTGTITQTASTTQTTNTIRLWKVTAAGGNITAVALQCNVGAVISSPLTVAGTVSILASNPTVLAGTSATGNPQIRLQSGFNGAEYLSANAPAIMSDLTQRDDTTKPIWAALLDVRTTGGSDIFKVQRCAVGGSAFVDVLTLGATTGLSVLASGSNIIGGTSATGDPQVRLSEGFTGEAVLSINAVSVFGDLSVAANRDASSKSVWAVVLDVHGTNDAFSVQRAASGVASLTSFFSIGSTGNVSISGSVGFNGTGPVAKPTVSGSRGGNAALASLLTALANTGILTDGSSA